MGHGMVEFAELLHQWDSLRTGPLGCWGMLSAGWGQPLNLLQSHMRWHQRKPSVRRCLVLLAARRQLCHCRSWALQTLHTAGACQKEFTRGRKRTPFCLQHQSNALGVTLQCFPTALRATPPFLHFLWWPPTPCEWISLWALHTT